MPFRDDSSAFQRHWAPERILSRQAKKCALAEFYDPTVLLCEYSFPVKPECGFGKYSLPSCQRSLPVRQTYGLRRGLILRFDLTERRPARRQRRSRHDGGRAFLRETKGGWSCFDWRRWLQVGPPDVQQPQRALMHRHLGNGYLEDALLFQRDRLVNLVNLPYIAVSQAGELDSVHIRVGGHLYAVILQPLAKFLGFDKCRRSWTFIQQGIVSLLRLDQVFHCYNARV